MAFDLQSQVVQPGLCAGCGLCESVAGADTVRMTLDTTGHFRPAFLRKLSPQASERIRVSCPGVGLDLPAPSVQLHPLWGPLVNVYAGHALDATVRYHGSSGGVISALALHLIESGKVNYVAQVAASSSDPLGSELQLSRTRDDVLRAAGSRYGPSAPLRRVTELLEGEGTFAFVGKPCDVAALRQYLRAVPGAAKKVPYMLSFMCAGVPSRNGTLELLRQLNVPEPEVASFRYRGDGWPGKAKAITKSGAVREMDYGTSWGTILNRHLQLRCKVCADGTGEFADVVGADAWYGRDGYPDFEEREGRSLVVARTPVGSALLDEARSAGVLDLTPFSVSEIAAIQPYQRHRKSVVLGRLLGLRAATGHAPRYRGLGLLRASLHASPVDWLRNMVGSFRRARGIGKRA